MTATFIKKGNKYDCLDPAHNKPERPVDRTHRIRQSPTQYFQYSRARPLPVRGSDSSRLRPHKENFKVKSPLKSSPSELVILCLKKGSHTYRLPKSHRLNLRWTECFFEDTILLDMEHRRNIRNHAEFIPGRRIAYSYLGNFFVGRCGPK